MGKLLAARLMAQRRGMLVRGQGEEAWAALREALAAPEEPVAWEVERNGIKILMQADEGYRALLESEGSIVRDLVYRHSDPTQEGAKP